MPQNDIIIQKLSKTYRTDRVLSDVSFTLHAGQTYCLMAPSGAGKTTLFRILLGLEKPDSGIISGLENQRISAVFQEDRLLEGYSALENLRFAAGRQLSEAQLSSLYVRLLPPDSLYQKVFEFSGGMKRRLSILRALLVPSDIILMDEPFTGLDHETRLDAIRLIREQSADRLLLFTTHIPEDASLLSAQILYLPNPE